MTIVLIIAAAAVAYVFGSLVGYETGKADGEAETLEAIERELRKGRKDVVR